jgi:FkbM family methyltransferase
VSQKVVDFRIAGLRRYLAQRTVLRFQTGQDGARVQALGQQLVIDGRDSEQKYFAADCTREPENYMLYAAIGDSGLASTYVDVGANCGLVAASTLKHFSRQILIEPNPKLANHLRQLFVGFGQVTVCEKAIVGDGDPDRVTLQVPIGSSGLASLNPMDIAQGHGEFVSYAVEATTLANICKDIDMSAAYVKIDVEGQEEAIIKSSASFFARQRPLVGFEALSREHAATCGSYFKDCNFYHARFAFMEKGGSLRNSKASIAKALLAGSTIEVLKETDLGRLSHDNYSQLIAVPIEKTDRFETALRNSKAARQATDIANLRFLSSR